ncbi:ESSS subunit of NADH:ubiquinone oxidoreductase-domain-containing protein [Cenococcum geophilum]
MPLLHPSRCAQRVTASFPSRTSASTSLAFRRSISSSRSLRSASGSHEDHYDPPSGWLWGVPPGQKYQKEGWENIWFWGFCGSLGLGVIAYAYKPDTSIQTWALEEARRRLEAEGILTDPGLTKGEVKAQNTE